MAESLVDGSKPQPANQTQELYWVEPGPEAKILSSRNEGDSWTSPELIYSSTNACASLAIVTDRSNTKYLVWSEKSKIGTQLMLATKAPGNSQWSAPRILSDFGMENNGATMVLDPSDTIWLFWSSNSGGLDDIYLRKKNQQEWSKRVRIHEPNQVPDIRPQAMMNDQGQIEVNWTKYDLDLGRYVGVSQRFELESSPNSDYKTEAEGTKDVKTVPNEVELPPFLPSWAISPLRHFPRSRQRQTIGLR